MSTQTLAFFENKTDEQIIDWMLSNLSEEQIKMCLNTSGIPDTSGLTTPVEPEPIAVVPVPSPTNPVVPPAPRGGSLNVRILNRLRETCPSNVILIEKLEGTTVYYYQFKEVTQEDMGLNSQYRPIIGQYRWLFRTQARNGMPETCRLASEASQDDIDEDPVAYRNPPPIITQIANDYVESGLPYPLPFGRSSVEPISQDVSIIYDSRIGAARTTQVNSSQKINEEKYPKIFKRGIRTFPVVIYKIEDNFLHYYALSIMNGTPSLVEKRVAVGPGYNTVFRRHAKELEDSIPDDFPESPNLIQITSELIERKPENIKDAIKQVYTINRTGEFAFFGSDESIDGEKLDELSGEMFSPVELSIGNMEVEEDLTDEKGESFELLNSPYSSQEVDVEVEMKCIDCETDDQLRVYTGRVSDLHCARCVERRDILKKGAASIAHTHYAEITHRIDQNGKPVKTVQWHPRVKGMVQFGKPNGDRNDLLLF